MGGKVVQARSDFLELVGGSKQKRPVNPENAHVRRNFFVLQDMRLSFAEIFLGDARDGSGRRHFADEHQHRQDHSDLDGHGKVGKHGQRKSRQPDADIQKRKLP